MRCLWPALQVARRLDLNSDARVRHEVVVVPPFAPRSRSAESCRNKELGEDPPGRVVAKVRVRPKPRNPEHSRPGPRTCPSPQGAAAARGTSQPSGTWESLTLGDDTAAGPEPRKDRRTHPFRATRTATIGGTIDAVPRLPRPAQTITEITRRDVFDFITLENVGWSGRLEETAFLDRIWDLNDMRSTDSRFKNAAGDIWQHRVNNPQDWEDDWVFTDDRFDLMHGSDETLLRFMCEMVHPAVRPNRDEVQQLVSRFNQMLAGDGWSLVATKQISGRPIFEARRTAGAKTPTTALRLPEYQRLRDPQVFHEHLRRIDAGLASDPPAAIASSKELVESVCKIILDDYGTSYGRNLDLLDLYKETAKALRLNAEAVPDSVKGSQAAQGALRALVTTVQRLAELRNELGLGHGRNRSSQALTRHARLAFNTSSAVAEFLLDTWHERRAEGADGAAMGADVRR